MALEVMIKDEKHPKAKDVLLLLQDVKKSWEENKLDEAVNYLKIARFFYEELDRTNGYNGEYNYLKETIVNTIEEIN